MRYIIGIGNYSMADDGIGLKLVETMADRGLNTDFEAIDLGNNGMHILSYFDPKTEKILVVDSARIGLKPGDYVVFSPDDVETHKALGSMTTHEGDILKILELARQLDYTFPPIRFMGIEPESFEPVMDLSDTLKSRFEEYLERAIQEIRSKEW